jgi:hypothetical protein
VATPSLSTRDSIFYSIIEPEWPEVRERIRLRLDR